MVGNGDTGADSGSGADREYAYTSETGLHWVKVDLGAVYLVDKVKIWHYATDGRAYHNTKTQVSEDGTSWTTMFDSATQGEYGETSAGKTHTFTARNIRYVRDWLNGSTTNSGNHWVEIEVWGTASITSIGNYFEWTGSASTMTKYYYAGNQRVAEREGSTLAFLLNDHLGSTTLTVDSVLGWKWTELRYKPWGENRSTTGDPPTTFRFTGPREAEIGLYYYGARWYDSYITRFNQPDSIVPGLEGSKAPSNPQAWDRYSYAFNNPLTYNDPTGHWPDLSNFLPKAMAVGAAVLDLTALGISTAGTILEGAAAVMGEVATPFPGIDSAVGIAGAATVYNTVLNPIENNLSAMSFGLTAASDVVSGQTHFETVEDIVSGGRSNELVFGSDTTFSFASITFGNTPLTPEAATDTVANIATTYYDSSRLAGREPFWGLYEFRVGHKQDADWFHGWYTRFLAKENESKE